MPTTEDIIKFIENNRQDFEDQFQVKRIGIFGSFARNQQSPESDIDLLVNFEVGTKKIHQKKKKLKQVFQEEFNKNVDIANPKYLKAFVRNQINSEAIYVY